MFNALELRKDFPQLSAKVNGKPLIYFDNAATSQKPIQVIDAVSNVYRNLNANVHRGVHTLSQEATSAFEATRTSVQLYLNAFSDREIIFTSGTTDSINLLAHSAPLAFLKEGDAILISAMEHHANIVPWQMACELHKLKLLVLPIDETGTLNLEMLPSLLAQNVKLVSVTWISNALGTINPISSIIEQAHDAGALVHIDAAQAVAHYRPDVQAMNCDFMSFSAHKMLGPTGVGIFYGKEALLNQMPPYKTGGEMIKEVTFEKTTFNELPFKFETGTPDISNVIGFKTAIDYLLNIDLEAARNYEYSLFERLRDGLSELDGIQFYGTAKDKAPVLSFLFEGVHPYDLGTMLDRKGIAIRTGHHCAQPIMQFFDIPGTCRVSISFYNTAEEVDFFLESTRKALSILR